MSNIGFFSPRVSVDNLDVSFLALPHFQTKFLHHPVVISPDANGTLRAKKFADKYVRGVFKTSFYLFIDPHIDPSRIMHQASSHMAMRDGVLEC